MLLCGGCKPFSLTRPCRGFTTEILSEHTPLNSVNVISVSNTLSFPALSLYGTNYRKRLLMPLLFTRLKTLSHHTFIPHPFDIIITVFIAVCICRMYTCISFFVLFVHPLLVKHKSYREKKKTPFLINRKRISVYQALFLRAGYQARMFYAPKRILYAQMRKVFTKSIPKAQNISKCRHSKNRIVIFTINLSCSLQMSEPI